MDFSRLQNLQYDFNSTNSTAASLPSTLLELVVPGYSTISQLAFRLLGIDIGVLVTGWAVLFGINTGARYLYDLIHGYFDEYYTSSVQIDDDDDLYTYVKAWLAEQKTKGSSRKLKAVTDYGNSNRENDENAQAEQGIFKYEVPLPRYEPTYGNDEFYHHGRHFKVTRERVKDDGGHSLKESIVIYCYGQTTKPIQDLLLDIRQWKLSQETALTSVYRAINNGGRYFSRQSCRPSRPLHTISLDQGQKDNIVDDINEYLHPATARWYAARGIPHRRGYLFHGPPGTGKTSLSFALAGVFGLDIYCVSLNDPDLNESELCQLFDSLPDRCIVLLEDIDSAGLRREELDATDAKPSSTTATVKDAKDTVRKPTDTSSPESSQGSISLSSLLNVIDGAASHEGHVLIMTTNTPEKLDAALIRPGRVDLQVSFTLATKEQIHETFMRMYSATPDEQATLRHHNNTSNDNKTLRKTPSVSKITEPEKLQHMASEFAEKLPEGKFSPAEIQGYLLMRKKEPQKALEEVGKWRDEVLEAKMKGKKVVSAQ